jgi:hypothetical protein
MVTDSTRAVGKRRDKLSSISGVVGMADACAFGSIRCCIGDYVVAGTVNHLRTLD